MVTISSLCPHRCICRKSRILLDLIFLKEPAEKRLSLASWTHDLAFYQIKVALTVFFFSFRGDSHWYSRLHALRIHTTRNSGVMHRSKLYNYLDYLNKLRKPHTFQTGFIPVDFSPTDALHSAETTLIRIQLYDPCQVSICKNWRNWRGSIWFLFPWTVLPGTILPNQWATLWFTPPPFPQGNWRDPRPQRDAKGRERRPTQREITASRAKWWDAKQIAFADALYIVLG